MDALSPLRLCDAAGIDSKAIALCEPASCAICALLSRMDGAHGPSLDRNDPIKRAGPLA